MDPEPDKSKDSMDVTLAKVAKNMKHIMGSMKESLAVMDTAADTINHAIGFRKEVTDASSLEDKVNATLHLARATAEANAALLKVSKVQMEIALDGMSDSLDLTPGLKDLMDA